MIIFLKKNNKKSQAAMEFLMNYGWALLVVLLVIAALAYFGMLNPERFLPDKVNLGPGLVVAGTSVNENFIQMLVNNGLGTPLYGFNINATTCGKDGVKTGTYDLAEGQTQKVLLPCKQPSKSSKFKTDMIVSYTTRTYGESTTHSRKGDLRYGISDGCVNSDLIEGFNFNNNMKTCSGKEGTCTGSSCPTKTADSISGSAYSFSKAEDDYIEMTSLTDSTKVTYSVWFKPEECAGNRILSFVYDLGADGWNPDTGGHSRSSITLYAGCTVRGSAGTYGPTAQCWEKWIGITSTSTASLNQWNHVALSIDFDNELNSKLYLNGTLEGTSSVAIGAPCSNDDNILWIGRRKMENNFQGSIDDVMIYKRILSDDEVKAIYDAGKK
jgi:uncharacterized protein (UPF0333 family)